jgi:rare lipoprotein A
MNGPSPSKLKQNDRLLWPLALPVILLPLLGLMGCSSTSYYQGTTTHNKHIKRAYNKSYKIKGVHYTPRQYYEYSEVGIASYYGPGDGFHGKKTSTGEVFNKSGLTAAHKTLPLPCVVRVTNLKNGRSIKLRVNDRGPFVKGRIIDVSERAAQLLGFTHDGITKVRVEALVNESIQLAHHYNPKDCSPFTVHGGGPTVVQAPTSTHPTLTHTVQHLIHKVPTKPKPHSASRGARTASALKGSYIQAGTYGSAENARHLAQKVASRVRVPCKAYPFEKSGRTLYRVLIGPLQDTHQSSALLQQLKAQGIKDALLINMG